MKSSVCPSPIVKQSNELGSFYCIGCGLLTVRRVEHIVTLIPLGSIYNTFCTAFFIKDSYCLSLNLAVPSGGWKWQPTLLAD